MMFGKMNHGNYNTIYNLSNKQKFTKTPSSTTGCENSWIKNQILLPMGNNNSFLGSGDYSNMVQSMSSSKATTISTNNIEHLPAMKAPSKNNGIDGYKIYSRSTMVEIAWQYDSKQWKEILGQNPFNNFGILLILQREKKLNVSNTVDESNDNGYTNDFKDNLLYSEYLQKSNPYSAECKKLGDSKLLTYSSSNLLSYDNFYTPYEIENETFINKKTKNIRTYRNNNKSQEVCVPKTALSTYGSQYSLPVSNHPKVPEMRKLWNSAYCGLLSNETKTDEANVYKMFLDKLIKKMSSKSSQIHNNKNTTSQTTTIMTLSEIENKPSTYTRDEILKISQKYTSKEWKIYVIKNFSNNNIIMKHLGREVFVVDSSPMRPKMSKEVRAILTKHKGKKIYVGKKKIIN